MSRLYVRWNDDLKEAVQLAVKLNGTSRTARELDLSDRVVYDLKNGLSRFAPGEPRRPRKFVKLDTVAALARLLNNPLIEDVEALPMREWQKRGEWGE